MASLSCAFPSVAGIRAAGEDRLFFPFPDSLAQALPPWPSRGMWVWAPCCVFLTSCNCSQFIAFLYFFRVGRRGCVCEGLRFFVSSKHSSLNGFDRPGTSLAHAWLPLPGSGSSCLVHRPTSCGDTHGHGTHSPAVVCLRCTRS